MLQICGEIFGVGHYVFGVFIGLQISLSPFNLFGVFVKSIRTFVFVDSNTLSFLDSGKYFGSFGIRVVKEFMLL